MIIVQAQAYDETTCDWTKPVEWRGARDEYEARDWIRFNKDWMKDFRIIEE